MFKVILRFLAMQRRYIPGLIASILLTLLYSAIFLFAPYITTDIFDHALGSGNMHRLMIDVILLFVIAAAGSLILLVSRYIFTVFAGKAIISLRGKCLNHLAHMTGDYYSKISTGDLLNTILDDTASADELLSNLFLSVLSDLLVAIGLFVYLAVMQADLLVAYLLIQPIVILAQHILSKQVGKSSDEYRNEFGLFTSLLQERISGALHQVLADMDNAFTRNFKRMQQKVYQLSIKLDFLHGKSSFLISLFSALVTAVIFGYGGWKVLAGSLTIGGLITFNVYAQRLIAPLMRMTQLNIELSQICVSLSKVFAFLDTEGDNSVNNSTYLESEQIEIEFDHVDFGYDRGEQILCDSNALFQPNCVTFINGMSGSGKTTIISLIFKLWKAVGGSITASRENIQGINTVEWRKRINYIGQHVYLINSTILENISPDSSEYDYDEINDVARRVALYDWIMGLPEQYQTIVGENGIQLSGGQRQRIALMRAMLRKDRPIMILDEATSALDAHNEESIFECLRPLFKDRTVIIISHRTSLMRFADVIYELRDGKLELSSFVPLEIA